MRLPAPLELFQRLRPEDAAPMGFTALPLPSRSDAWIGCDGSGAPAILIPDSVESSAYTPIETRHVRVRFGALCDVSTPRGRTQGRFTVIECRASDSLLTTHFLETTSSLLAWLPAQPEAGDIRRAIDALIELFRAIDRPGRKAIQGLWGELLVMALSAEPAMLLGAWHTTPGDRFDFALGTERIEVKTSVDGSRIHHFALEQIRPAGCVVAVASLGVQTTGGGQTIKDLAREIHDMVQGEPSLHMKLDRLVFEVLGRDWSLADRERFDRGAARQSLRFLDAATIPAVDSALPNGVSQVSFMADVSSGVQLDRQTGQPGGLWKAMWPR